MTLYQCPLCKRLEASDAEAPPKCECSVESGDARRVWQRHGIRPPGPVMREIVSFRDDAVWHDAR